MRALILCLCLMFFIIGCDSIQNKPTKTFHEIKSETIPFNKDLIKVEGDLGDFNIVFESIELETGLEIVSLILKSNNPSIPPNINLTWSFPSVDIYQFWNSNIQTDKVTYYINNLQSRASSQVPVICYMNNRDNNRITIAISDGLNKIKTNTWLREEDSKFHWNLELFSEPHPEITEYKLDLRIDRRAIQYYKSIYETSDWYATMDKYKPAYVPDIAKMPMYSTWYSFHQNLDVNEVIRECKLGKEIGLEAVIIDDGWQTLDNKRGYAFTGDWKPERLGDMKAFVDSLHAFDMKVLLWYSLPFVGENAQIFSTFEGKFLHHWESQGTWVLDPRYPEVREHIIKTYEQALTNWDLDGFKLDFLGWFYADDKTDLTANDGRDHASVNEATDKLMTAIMDRLRLLKPDIMIEFRQPYIGPIMRKYGNMFRAADCPNMGIVNRVRTTDLRIASGNTAVHSDMFMWHKEDPVESAALQILNILFSVPQLSVKLDSIPPDHLQMASFWINYWKENRSILLDGNFIPVNPGGLYPVLKSMGEEKEIIALYQDQIVDILDNGITMIDIVNAKGSTTVLLNFESSPGKSIFKVFNCLGELEEEYEKILKSGPIKVSVPPSGLIQIENIS